MPMLPEKTERTLLLPQGKKQMQALVRRKKLAVALPLLKEVPEPSIS